MKRFGSSVRTFVVIAGMVFGSASAFADKPADKPAADAPAKPAKRVGPPQSLTDAIAELNKEFAEFAAKPDGDTLRKKSDYFKSMPEDATVEDVMSILERGLPGSAGQTAYVKYELLSACPSKFDGQMASRAYRIYISAPTPAMRFGSDRNVKQQLDQMIRSLKEDKDDATLDAINEKVAAARVPIDAMNAVIIGYRDTLYAHLPVNGDTLIARLQDAVIRCQAGISPGTIMTNFGTDVRSWIAVDANPSAANAVLSALQRATEVKGTVVYSKAKWEKKKLSWGKDTPKIEDKDDVIAKLLKNYIRNPSSGTLKFKEN
ncbi:hypothetical protein BH10PLA1_BH10PLA1_20070 [soil metagenome]